jgi:hypothetical protein
MLHFYVVSTGNDVYCRYEVWQGILESGYLVHLKCKKLPLNLHLLLPLTVKYFNMKQNKIKQIF